MQPPESPIPDSLWKVLFHATAAVTSAAMLYSIYAASSAARGGINEQLAVLKKKNATEEEIERAVDEIIGVLDLEARLKRGCSRLAVIDNSKLLLSHLRSERENSSIVSGILTIIRRSVHDDDDARVAFNRADGCKRVMIALVQAFNHGKTKLVEDAANTLKELTNINDDDIVMNYDVPKGAEGALQLSKLAVVANMLRNLDPAKSPSLAMLIGISGIYANLCALQTGARNIAKGVDGRSGLSYFYPLVDPSTNVLIVENAVRAISWIAAHVPAAQEEIAEPVNVRRIMSILQLNRDKRTLSHVLSLVSTMATSKKHCNNFFSTWFEGNGGAAIFEIFTRSSEAELREQAQDVIMTLNNKTDVLFTDRMRRLFDQYRKAINDRRAADEQARRQAQQQQRQQQMMMQQMMMMGGGGGGDMGGMEMDE